MNRTPPPLGPLCEQQFWLFGCDVRRPAGNLLVERGFRRQRQGPARPTRYLLENADETIALWGFGMMWIPKAHAPGVFLARNGNLFETALRSVPRVREAWRVRNRLALRDAGDPSSAVDALAWVADYERWVAGAAGAAHRRRSLAETAPCCEAEFIPAAWEEHARRLGQASMSSVA